MQVLDVSKSRYILLIGLGLLEIEITIKKMQDSIRNTKKLIIKLKQKNK